MAYSRYYSRLFITLKQERPDFCLDFRPAMGRCIVEIRNNKGKLSVYAQGLKPRILYKIFIIKCESGNSLGIPVGLIPIDDNGKGEIKWNFEPDNVGESKCKIEEFNVVALVVQEHNEIIAPLVGYTENAVLWKNNFKSFNKDEINNKNEEKKDIKEKTINNINDSKTEKEEIKENQKTINEETNNKEIEQEVKKDIDNKIETEEIEESNEDKIEIEKNEENVNNEINIENEEENKKDKHDEIQVKEEQKNIINKANIEAENEKIKKDNDDKMEIEANKEIINIDEEDDDDKIFLVDDDENIYYFEKEDIDNQQKNIIELKEVSSKNKEIEGNKENDKSFTENKKNPEINQINEKIKSDSIKNDNINNENQLNTETEEISKKINDIINNISTNDSKNNNINNDSDKINENDENIKDNKTTAKNISKNNENKENSNIHDNFKSIVKKFKEEMEELKFYTFMTEEKNNKDLNNDKSEEKKMNDIDYMFENNLLMTPFDKQNKDIKWIKINIKELAVFKNDLWRYINNPFFACACKKYKHLILGRQSAENGYTYILGVPGIYSADYKLEAGLQGLKIFKCCEDKIPENNDYGYWIMYINE